MSNRLTTIAGITAYRTVTPVCDHLSARAYRAEGYATAHHWQCDECGEVTPMDTDAIAMNALGAR